MNNFEKFRCSSKELLAEDWNINPDVSEYKTENIYTDADCSISILFACIDTKFVVGVKVFFSGCHYGYIPNLKWGYFLDINNAKVWALYYILDNFPTLPKNVKSVIYNSIRNFRQTSLF